MTETFNELDADSLGVDKIARSATAYALYNNAIAIAQRGTNAPWLNGIGAMEVLTSGTSWTVPDGVYRVKATLVGGGGGGGGSTVGGSGGNTTFSTATANGGGGGGVSDSSGTGGTSGSSSGGSLNMPSVSGLADPFFGFGATSTNDRLAYGYGQGGRGGDDGTYGAGRGGAGGVCVAILTVIPGASVSYAIGSGGTGRSDTSVNGTNGAPGIIILEY